MNDLTTAAVERLTAQLGEALFGEPGLSLMEIANRRAEIEQMARDAGRLDWLVKERNIRIQGSDERGWVALDCSNGLTFIAGRTTQLRTSREAIDAAMAAMKEQAE